MLAYQQNLVSNKIVHLESPGKLHLGIDSIILKHYEEKILLLAYVGPHWDQELINIYPFLF